MRKFICLIFAAFIALIAFVAPAKAEAKSWMHPGIDGRGVAVLGETEVEVKSERVTLNLPTRADGDAPYRIKAEYSLFNPAETPRDITFIYPLGEDYYYTDDYGYSVKADGEDVVGTIRHTAYFHGFDYENGLKLASDKASGGFFDENLPVTVYTYSAEKESEGDIVFKFDPEKTRVFAQWGSYEKKKDGSNKVGIILDGGNTFELYITGAEIPAPAFKCKRGKIGLQKTEKTVLGNLIKEPPEKVSAVDWYNAVISCLEYESKDGAVGDAYVFSPQNWLYRWYVYTVTVPAGGTVINAVMGDIYPSLNTAYEPYLETYGYAVSPLDADFTFTVLTEKYLYKTEGFEKAEGGYVYSGKKPQQALSVTLCSAEKPKKIVTPWEIFLYILSAAIILIIVSPIIAAVTVLIVRVVKKRKKENENL